MSSSLSAKPDQFIHTAAKTTPAAPRFTGELLPNGEYIHSNGDICESDCENARNARRRAEKKKGKGVLHSLSRSASRGAKAAGEMILDTVEGIGGLAQDAAPYVEGALEAAGRALEAERALRFLEQVRAEYDDVRKNTAIIEYARGEGIRKNINETDIGFSQRVLKVARTRTPDMQKEWDDRIGRIDTTWEKKIHEIKGRIPFYHPVERLKAKTAASRDADHETLDAEAQIRRERNFRDQPEVQAHRQEFQEAQAPKEAPPRRKRSHREKRGRPDRPRREK